MISEYVVMVLEKACLMVDRESPGAVGFGYAGNPDKVARDLHKWYRRSESNRHGVAPTRF